MASGEIKEYRQKAISFIPADAPHQKWFDWVQKHLVLAAEQNYSQIIKGEREVFNERLEES